MDPQEYLLESGALSLSDIILENEDNDVHKHYDEGKAIADKLGLMYNGWWEDMGKFVFSDPETETTFVAIDDAEAIDKIKEKRDLWAKAAAEKEKYA